MYLLAIASAQKTLRIENAYFLPDTLTLKELVAAAKRGVKVEVIMPGKHIDQKLVRAASRRHWPELIKAGIKLYEYQPTMVHVKLMIVDDTFVSVGSGNFDNRSVRLNDEANLDVLDRGFAREQIRLLKMIKSHSRAITLNNKGWPSCTTTNRPSSRSGLAAIIVGFRRDGGPRRCHACTFCASRSRGSFTLRYRSCCSRETLIVCTFPASPSTRTKCCIEKSSPARAAAKSVAASLG